ncbi:MULTISPECIES: UDP-N-acetylmuramoyl-tripeptide--D-alanyl-D-alanine ligase [unclassified Arthrobacter]|uniref:UDP-N-acetylmuramoyl-tripeptide--D-alanyl-D- alanine ligase n=1 Tax=unclassified Arthrobacter TaxID=235627 RepID=UPI001492CE69|nr:MULTISPECIES: UDP-N-acetylmuramoyl-tripeptide--D-alanyl-D-alanine ligase [unclassified Arthrobacter]MBE0009870.1 UDP-N-acetylmuramoyl-tripeptide--D-alanyl-D-alanine ligase [Arthrobacter sp. AET 35A]NOJ63790.1 UDP-N-acetylmuramoyl-tripeptide--D-alanyl-D-alanine ligase [Arthrobacter sp. 147(2020)]
MIELSAAEIAAITRGALTPAAAARQTLAVTSVSVDSREVKAGGLFVAKTGDTADGHQFVPQAFRNGAVLALVEHPVPQEQPDGPGEYPAVVVDDVVLAMGRLAAEVVRRLRAHSPLTVIGITGSAGKTTTKDLLAGILTEQAPTVAPIGSYNGEVGVPLTVFSAEYGTRYLIIEMGATKIGQITYLADMVAPDIGVVLGVGSAHAGEFGGVDNIARAKSELVRALPASGTAVINADDARVLAMESVTAAQRLYFTSDSSQLPDGGPAVRATAVTTTVEGHPAFDLVVPAADGGTTTYPVTAKLIGTHQITNLLAAASVASALGIPGHEIAAALSRLQAQSRWRMERSERADGVTIINDAYNANPESMRAALRTLAELGRGRRTWAVLGEMLELGEDSINEHDAVGRVVVRLNITKLLVVGMGARALYNGAVLEGSWGDEVLFAADVAEAETMLTAALMPGDLVLFKSSNGSGLRFLGDRIALSSTEPTTAMPGTSAPGPTDLQGGPQL